jgi:hypothetical protein
MTSVVLGTSRKPGEARVLGATTESQGARLAPWQRVVLGCARLHPL